MNMTARHRTARHVAARHMTDPDLRRDAGMTTAEYAVGTVAACGFGGILYKLLTSPEVVQMLKDVIERAFSLAF